MGRSLLAILLLCVAGATSAQTPDTVFLERLTWTEVRDAIAAGKTTIIIPTGGTEQNGPHMAIGKHNVRVAANAEAIARRLGNALVAPVVAYTPEGAIDPPAGNHADPRDTSQMMAIDPSMVRNDKIVPQDGRNGIQGDPRGSTPEIGRALLDKNIGRTVEMIQQSIAAR